MKRITKKLNKISKKSKANEKKMEKLLSRFSDSAKIGAAWSEHGIKGFEIEWSSKGVGFGSFQIFQDDGNDKIYMETECMSREFILGVLARIVANAKIV